MKNRDKTLADTDDVAIFTERMSVFSDRLTDNGCKLSETSEVSVYSKEDSTALSCLLKGDSFAAIAEKTKMSVDQVERRISNLLRKLLS